VGGFLKRVWRRVSRRKHLVDPGLVNFTAFDNQIERYQKMGVQIGRMVRLLGKIDGMNPHLVSIGDYSVVGTNSALLAHCPIRGALPCRIGRFVYISYGAIILPGVTVGDHCLIGAGAVVTKDVPEGSVVAGNPARVLRSMTQDEQDKIEQTMLEGRLFGWDENQSA
jgi:acetyltransferase-like isoleucine patch superfamily enzyme